MMETTFSRPTLKLFFGLYCVAVAYMVFIYQREIDFSWMIKNDLFTNLDTHLNLIPFKNIIGYIIQMNRVTGLNVILENIVAHMFVFSWLGYFMPRIWIKYQNPIQYIITVLLILTSIEVIQFFTRSGMCDIDDLILNFSAALLGFIYLRHIHSEEEEIPYV